MTKTQNSLLNTPLRSPVRFADAPRNPIPTQQIPPLGTPRVSLGSQRVAVHPISLHETPLQAIAGQPQPVQPLQHVSLQKQQIGLSASSVKRVSLHATPMRSKGLSPLKTSKRTAVAESFTSAKTGLSTGSHKPLEPLRPFKLTRSTALIRRETLKPLEPHKSLDSLSSLGSRKALEPLEPHKPLKSTKLTSPIHHEPLGSTKSSAEASIPFEPPFAAPPLSERRIALQGQEVELHPIPAVQHPVRTRTSRPVSSSRTKA